MDKEETFIPDDYNKYSSTVDNEGRSSEVLIKTLDKLIDLKSINYKTMADHLWIYFENNVYSTRDKEDWNEDDLLLDKIDHFRRWFQKLDYEDFESISGLDVIASKLEQYVLINLDKLEDEIIGIRNKDTVIEELNNHERTSK